MYSAKRAGTGFSLTASEIDDHRPVPASIPEGAGPTKGLVTGPLARAALRAALAVGKRKPPI
jgi:hypothetical protein